MRTVLVILGFVACTLQATAQYSLPDLTLEKDFADQVKSLHEFMARFNGEESKPDIELDSLSRRNNILSLFDFKINRDSLTKEEFKDKVLNFIVTAIEWPHKLSLKDSKVFAEVLCKMKYKKQDLSITLLMQQESIDNERSRWGIMGVKGLRKYGFYDDKRVTISPVDHEVHFITLQDFFQSNSQLAASLRSRKKGIDEFSLFVGLVMSNAIQFIQVDDLKFHVADIPNYIFTIEEITRRGSNSGWLITYFEKKTNEEKIEYINELIGK